MVSKPEVQLQQTLEKLRSKQLCQCTPVLENENIAVKIITKVAH